MYCSLIIFNLGYAKKEDVSTRSLCITAHAPTEWRAYYFSKWVISPILGTYAGMGWIIV